MSPGEIRACYRLYAAHRKSHEICTFPETILLMKNVGAPNDLAVLLRLHTGLEGLALDIGSADPDDDQATAGHIRHLHAPPEPIARKSRLGAGRGSRPADIVQNSVQNSGGR